MSLLRINCKTKPTIRPISENIRCFSDLHHRHTSRSQFQGGSTCDALLGIEGILSQLNFEGQALTLPDRLVPSLRTEYLSVCLSLSKSRK
ncbi:hypothetical protein Bca4012_099244 [Brassica carinata]